MGKNTLRKAFGLWLLSVTVSGKGSSMSFSRSTVKKPAHTRKLMWVKGKLKADGCSSRSIFYLRSFTVCMLCQWSLTTLSMTSCLYNSCFYVLTPILVQQWNARNNQHTEADKIVRSPTYPSISFPDIAESSVLTRTGYRTLPQFCLFVSQNFWKKIQTQHFCPGNY